MAQARWAIRVVQFVVDQSGRNNPDVLPGVWLEQFRRMGYVQELGSEGVGTTMERVIFEIYPPHQGHRGYEWAKQNAERMQSFGINAVVAPVWVSGTTVEGHHGLRS